MAFKTVKDVKSLLLKKERISCVHEIQLLDPKDPTRPQKIPRMMGLDDQGHLEIASTVDLVREMDYFKKSFFKTDSGNPSGWNLRYLYDRDQILQKLYGSPQRLFDSVRFLYQECGPKDLLKVRQRLLDSYMSEFGEPPLIQGQSRTFMKRGELGAEMAFDEVEIIGPQVLDPSAVKGISCVYWVHLMDPEDPSRTLPLQRFQRTDPLGVLVAGKTRDLQSKIWYIRSSMVHHEHKHRGEWGLFGHIHGLCGPLEELCGPLEEFRYKLGISYAPMVPGALGRGEVWALNRSIREYGEMPPYNSQIPGDTRYKR